MVVDLYDITSDQAAPVCVDKVKAVIISKPVEECDMEPQRECKQITKLVPGLVPQEECVQVPKEVCAMSKINPKKIKVPFIKNWCYDPKEFTTTTLPAPTLTTLQMGKKEDFFCRKTHD